MTRHIIPLLALVAVLTTGCRYGEVLAFGGGGKGLGPDTGGDGGTSTDGDDTAFPPDDSGMGPTGSPPSILNVSTSVEDYPDIGWVAELTITYTDPDGDVDGGKVDIVADLDGQDEILDISVPIDGSQAIDDAEEGTVFLALQVNDGDVSGSMTLQLMDAADNSSEPYDLPL
jgi:hypothetical protein